MSKEIAVPFRLGADGRVVTISDPDAQVRQHVFALINTQPEERVMLNEYGVDSMGMLFEDGDPGELAASLSTEIADAMATWEPGVTIRAVVPVVNDEAEAIRVDVLYERKDSPTATGNSGGFNSATIAADGTVKETIRG